MKFIFKSLLFLIILSAVSCQQVKNIINTQTPREQFLTSLEKSELGDKRFVSEWQSAWNQAENNAVNIILPYREKGIFFPNESNAAGLRFSAQRGELISIVVNADFQLFVEVYTSENNEKKLIGNFTNDQRQINIEADNNKEYTLLIQPELLSGGSYELIITRGASVGFPVSGKNSNAIQSFWGAGRDGGSRKHEGVDIFAERGTPVLAVASGLVRSGNNNLGGKVVWLSQPTKGRSFYYAHLDSQMVSMGTVKPGDTLGLVGNTGNARYTAPHLHFGIYYSGRGAVDPFPFIDNIREAPADIVADTALNGNYAVISGASANVRSLPTTNSAVDTSLSRNTVIKVASASSDWYRVEFPDGKTGFIHSSLVAAPPGSTIKEEGKYSAWLDPWNPDTYLDSVDIDQSAFVLGNYDQYQLIRQSSGNKMWIKE